MTSLRILKEKGNIKQVFYSLLSTNLLNMELLLTYQTFYGRGPVMRVHKSMLKNTLAFRNELPILNLKSTLSNLRKTLRFFYDSGKRGKTNMFLTAFADNVPNSVFVQRWMPGFLTNYRLYLSIYYSAANLYGLGASSKGLSILYAFLTFNFSVPADSCNKDRNRPSRKMMYKTREVYTKKGDLFIKRENRTAKVSRGFKKKNSITIINGVTLRTKYKHRRDPNYREKNIFKQRGRFINKAIMKQEYKRVHEIPPEVGSFPASIFITPYKNMPLREGLRTGINTGGFVDAHVDSARYFYPLIGNENNGTLTKFIVRVLAAAKQNGQIWTKYFKGTSERFFKKFPLYAPIYDIFYQKERIFT